MEKEAGNAQQGARPKKRKPLIPPISLHRRKMSYALDLFGCKTGLEIADRIKSGEISIEALGRTVSSPGFEFQVACSEGNERQRVVCLMSDLLLVSEDLAYFKYDLNYREKVCDPIRLMMIKMSGLSEE